MNSAISQGAGWRRAPRLSLGAPGLYRHPQEEARRIAGVRMDVAAFVGVAPRGPVREPLLEEFWRYDRPCVEPGRRRRRSVAVPVESFDEYRRMYGGLEGPGRLPHAVAAFFEQGGRRAYVVRVVHDYGDPVEDASAVAWGPLMSGRVKLEAAAGAVLPAPATLRLAQGSPVEAGSTLWLRAADGSEERLRAIRTEVAGDALEVSLESPASAEPETIELLSERLLALKPAAPPVQPEAAKLRLAKGSPVSAGDVLRLRYADDRVEDFEVVGAVAGADAVEVELGADATAKPVAIHRFGGVALVARSEGAWGNELRASMGFKLAARRFEEAAETELVFARDEAPPVGALLRITVGARPVLSFVSAARRVRRDGQLGSLTAVTLDPPLGAPIAESVVVEEVLGTMTVQLPLGDGSVAVERHEDLGLSAAHPRWVATVLCYESELVFPEAGWAGGEILPPDPVALPAAAEEPLEVFAGGFDRYQDICPEDFFDGAWVLGDPEPGSGVHALAHLEDLSTVVVPDLYDPVPFVREEDLVEEPLSLNGPTFERCLELAPPDEMEQPTPELDKLRLDPRQRQDLDAILKLQRQLRRLAEDLCSWVVLLDVPPGLQHRQILNWRAELTSSYVAAYHPWLRVARPVSEDPERSLLRLNPSAAAAGIIAASEAAFGVPHGPANVLARTVVGLEETVLGPDHDELHPAGVNVYLSERDGVQLTAARTLSGDPRYRQLSVRRLMSMLRRVLRQQMQWMVFEPNGPALRAEVRQMLRTYLRQLFRAGAFRGSSESEAFFVRCDQALNPERVVDAGQLIAEVGVAPAEPIEFIVIRLVRGADGTLVAEV